MPPPLPPRDVQSRRQGYLSERSNALRFAARQEGAVAVPASARFDGSKYLSQLGQQFIDPNSSGDALTLNPSSSTQTADVKLFTETFKISADALGGANSSFEMRVSPKLKNTLSVTGSQFLPPINETYLDWTGPTKSIVDPWDDNQCLVGGINCNASLNAAVYGVIETDTIGDHYGWAINAGGALEPVRWTLVSSTTCHPEVQVYNGVNWTAVGDGQCLPFVPLVINWTSSAFTAFRVMIRYGVRVPVCSLSFEALGSGSQANPRVTVSSIENTDAIQVVDVERYRVTGLSVLCTFSGDELNDGGLIAAARVQPGYSSLGNAYRTITSITDHQYHGAMKFGCYAWWLPNSIAETEFEEPTNLKLPPTSLAVAGTFANASGELEVTISMIVEFYSPSQLFAKMTGFPITPKYGALLAELNRIPAACCNPSHRELFRAMMSKGKKFASDGVRYLVENPEVLAKVLSSFI